MALSGRLGRLERSSATPEDCRGGITCILTHEEGEPEPPVPADACRCRRCGRPHVLVLTEVVVGASP
jgi:hypothetical protein